MKYPSSSQNKEIKMNIIEEDMIELEKLFKQAKNDEKGIVMYKGKEILVSYLKYLIEYYNMTKKNK